MSSSINSLGIKLGNTNCRLACATITEWNSLRVNCLNGINEQFATKTLFTVKANADYSEGFEYCLANNNAHPSNIVFDALNLNNYTSICYSDEEFGEIFAKKQENGKYKLKDKYQPKKIVEYKDIEVIAGILSKLIEKAKEQLPEKGAGFQQIVITIPSWAEYEYREKILKAVKILSLDIDVQLIAQITAAAITYRHKEGDAANGGVLFFYMGARNTEFAIYKFLDGQTPKLCHADGFMEFGGENFTAKLVEVQMADLKWEKDEKWSEMDYEEKRTVYRNVRMAMEKIKAQLDCIESATVIMDLGLTLLERTFTITREQFETICRDQCEQLESFLSSIFNKFNGEINRIVLVGESTKLYLLKSLVGNYSNNSKILPMNALAPELASAYGAAIKAAYVAFEKSRNEVPKCLTKAIIPNYVFREIYGNSPTLPSIQFGQQIPTKSIQIGGNSHTTFTWHEQCGNGNNDKQIIKFKKWVYEKYFWKIDKNGLIQFVRIDNKIWCQNDDLELDECIKRFKQYDTDVIRVKYEQIEYEKKRKEERRLKAQKRQKELEEKKQRQEEAKKAAEELSNKQKLINENKDFETIAEVKVNDKVGRGFKQKKFAILPMEQASEVIAPDSNIADVLFEYKYENKQVNTAIYLIGSWDNWKGKIPMKYSQFTNSFLIVLSLPISKGEYEFFFEIHYRRRNICFNTDVVDWYLNYNYPRRRRMHEISEVNFVELNSTTQIDNQNSSWTKNKDLLEKILKIDNSMDKLVNQMKNRDKLEFANDFIDKITQKYLEIRKSLSKKLQINSREVKTLIDEADRVHIYLKIIFFVLYDWANIEKGSIILKESENAQTIHIAFKDELLKLTMSKEEAIYHFKCTFSYPLLSECRRIGLGETSTEIQQLNAFLNADFPSFGTSV